jgi:cysteine desulfurase
MATESVRISELRNALETALLQVDGAQVNGSTRHRLPNITNISFKNTESEGLMMRLNKYLAMASGSACTSASVEPSYVLKAIGLSDELAHSSLRFGVGRFTTQEEIDFAVEKITAAINMSASLNLSA